MCLSFRKLNANNKSIFVFCLLLVLQYTNSRLDILLLPSGRTYNRTAIDTLFCNHKQSRNLISSLYILRTKDLHLSCLSYVCPRTHMQISMIKKKKQTRSIVIVHKKWIFQWDLYNRVLMPKHRRCYHASFKSHIAQ